MLDNCGITNNIDFNVKKTYLLSFVEELNLRHLRQFLLYAAKSETKWENVELGIGVSSNQFSETYKEPTWQDHCQFHSAL